MNDDQKKEGTGSPRRHPGKGPDPVEHGKRATFDPKSGEVHGSGSGAGGGGNPREDYDGDPMAGAGQAPQGDARPIEEAVQRPIDPDEGA